MPVGHLEPMAPSCDRRAFLRRVGIVSLVAPTMPLVACDAAPGTDGAAEEDRVQLGESLTRPVLLPWSADAVRISAPALELPVAYVSMARRQLFVDHDYRDQVFWDLRAYISVSTGVWRIPLVGDPPKVPIEPGDALREFEELAARDWDPTADPAEGDIRIMRGSPVRKRIDFACAPLSGADAWLRAGPWEILQCGDPSEALCREDFMSVGTGTRYSDRDCTRPEGSVRFVTWACRPDLNPSTG